METLKIKIWLFYQKLKKSHLMLAILGLAALIWFLIRVIPKPSRASYPCQRAAFPLASSFVIWITGFFISRKLFFSANDTFKRGMKLGGSLVMFFALLALVVTLFFGEIANSVAYALYQAKISNISENLIANNKAALEDIISPQAVVGISRSKKANATDIKFEEVDSLIRAAVKLAGGFDTLIHDGDTVVLKPNVIASHDQKSGSFKTFPSEANGIATDYRVIQVVVNMVREKNASGKIYLLEGSGYGLTRPNMKAIGYEQITGLDSIIYLDEQPGDWHDITSPEIVKVSLPEGKNLYSTKNEYYLNKIYARAQVLISLPCLKTHFLTGVTGSVKNVGIGATPTKIYGFGPNNGVSGDDIPGRWGKIDHGDFSSQTVQLDKWIHDFYMCRKVDYVIMDGLQGAQYGPYPGSSGDNKALPDVQMNMRVILAGKDPLAVDAIEAVSIGVNPLKVGHLVYLAQDNVGCINPAYIKVKGAQVENFKKLFKEHSPGYKCLYNDLIQPMATLDNLTFENSKLVITLSNTTDITKAEVMYGDSTLDQIIVSNFEKIYFSIEESSVDLNKVTIKVYDQYLNCNKLSLKYPSKVSHSFNKGVKVYPNPAYKSINIEYSDVYKTSNYAIFSMNGQQMISGDLTSKIDIENLKKGNYILKIYNKDNCFSQQFIKN